MKKNVMGFVCSLAMVVLMISSCSKEGTTGPAGPAGPAGPTGAAGAAGPAGSANVIYSPWIDVTYNIDTIIVSNGIRDTSYFTVIEAAKLTNAILTNGEIKVYINLRNAATPVVFPLPYQSLGGDYIQPIFFTGSIELDASENFGTFTSGGTKYYQYRYILIPGGVPARSSIDWNNYADVKEKLNLRD
jgi:hypothetical protein